MIFFYRAEFLSFDHYSLSFNKINTNHPEHKFDGDTGVIERKHVHADGVVYIGEEANNIDEQKLDVKKAQEFLNEEEIKRKILEMPQKEAERLGVGRSTLHKIKWKIRKGEKINWKGNGVRKLIYTIV